MAAVTLRNTLEGGTPTVAISSGNSGGASGDAFTAAAGLSYFNDTAAHGSISAGVDNPATATAIVRWATGSAEKAFACRFYFRHSLATTADLEMFEIRAANDSTYLLRCRMQGTNRLRLVDSAGTHIWTSTAALPVDTWYCVSVRGDTGTTTSDGAGQVAYRALGDASWIEAPAAFTGNYGAGSLAGNARLGKTGSTTYGGNLRLDTIELRTGSDVSGLIDPYTPPATYGWQVGSIAMG
jgi:hypothetical protein